MSSEITVLERQGLRFVRDEDGREFAIPAGGSDNAAPPSNDGGGTAPSDGGGVQPEEGGDPSGQSSGGQGFIEPYLEGVDESVRPVVQERLEQFRQDQDAQVTRRFDQLKSETEVPVTVYNALMNDPVGTLQWITERFQEDRGLDLRSQLLQSWGVDAQGQPTQDPEEMVDENKPLTQADIDRILEEREQERERQQREMQTQQQRAEEQTRTVYNWMDEAAKAHGLEFQDADGAPDPLRTAIALQANDLHNSGQARGKAAVEMVVETMAKRFGSSGSGKNNDEGGGEPRTANGGTAPPAKEINVADRKERRDRMAELFIGGQ